MREAVAKPAPRPPGTQARARGQRAERSRPGAVLGPWGDCSTCPPVPRFVVRSGSWASPWGPGPVPALPPTMALEPLARAAECHILPPLTPHRHPRRPRAGLAPCIHQDHSPPTLCPLPGVSKGAGSRGADLEDTTMGWRPASTQAPFQKVAPGRPPQKGTVPPSTHPQPSLRASPGWGPSSRRCPSQKPHDTAAPRSSQASVPALGTQPCQAAGVPQPTAGPPEA